MHFLQPEHLNIGTSAKFSEILMSLFLWGEGTDRKRTWIY